MFLKKGKPRREIKLVMKPLLEQVLRLFFVCWCWIEEGEYRMVADFIEEMNRSQKRRNLDKRAELTRLTSWLVTRSSVFSIFNFRLFKNVTSSLLYLVSNTKRCRNICHVVFVWLLICSFWLNTTNGWLLPTTSPFFLFIVYNSQFWTLIKSIVSMHSRLSISFLLMNWFKTRKLLHTL